MGKFENESNPASQIILIKQFNNSAIKQFIYFSGRKPYRFGKYGESRKSSE